MVDNDNLVKVIKMPGDIDSDPVVTLVYNEVEVKEQLQNCNNLLIELDRFIRERNKAINMRKLAVVEGVHSSMTEYYEPRGDYEEHLYKTGRALLKDERICRANYKAYNTLINEESTVIDNLDKLRKYWRIIMRDRLHLRGFRKTQVYVGANVGGTRVITHMAPKAYQVKGLLDEMFNELSKDKYGEDVLLKSILYHYVFAYIHPFIDGNGRTARLINVGMLMDGLNLKYMPQLSYQIYAYKSVYLDAFKSGKYRYGDDTVDMTAFIKAICWYLSKACIDMAIAYKYKDSLTDEKIAELDDIKLDTKFKSRGISVYEVFREEDIVKAQLIGNIAQLTELGGYSNDYRTWRLGPEYD